MRQIQDFEVSWKHEYCFYRPLNADRLLKSPDEAPFVGGEFLFKGLIPMFIGPVLMTIKEGIFPGCRDQDRYRNIDVLNNFQAQGRHAQGGKNPAMHPLAMGDRGSGIGGQIHIHQFKNTTRPSSDQGFLGLGRVEFLAGPKAAAPAIPI